MRFSHFSIPMTRVLVAIDFFLKVYFKQKHNIVSQTRRNKHVAEMAGVA